MRSVQLFQLYIHIYVYIYTHGFDVFKYFLYLIIRCVLCSLMFFLLFSYNPCVIMSDVAPSQLHTLGYKIQPHLMRKRSWNILRWLINKSHSKLECDAKWSNIITNQLVWNIEQSNLCTSMNMSNVHIMYIIFFFFPVLFCFVLGRHSGAFGCKPELLQVQQHNCNRTR